MGISDLVSLLGGAAARSNKDAQPETKAVFSHAAFEREIEAAARKKLEAAARKESDWSLTAHRQLKMELSRVEAEEQAKLARQRLQQEAEEVAELLRSPAMACTLDTAVDLWIVKYGDGWVPVTDIQKDDNMDWTVLHFRLKEARYVESFTGLRNPGYVRIIERAKR